VLKVSVEIISECRNYNFISQNKKIKEEINKGQISECQTTCVDIWKAIKGNNKVYLRQSSLLVTQ
jgi:hypothetical protein